MQRAFRKSLLRVHRANIKSALKSTSRERQYVSRPSIVSHEILEQSASTKRLKFIVRGVVIALHRSRFYVITGPSKMETACQISASFLFSRPKLTRRSKESSRCLLAYFMHREEITFYDNTCHSVTWKIPDWYFSPFHARGRTFRT